MKCKLLLLLLVEYIQNFVFLTSAELLDINCK